MSNLKSFIGNIPIDGSRDKIELLVQVEKEKQSSKIEKKSELIFKSIFISRELCSQDDSQEK